MRNCVGWLKGTCVVSVQAISCKGRSFCLMSHNNTIRRGHGPSKFTAPGPHTQVCHYAETLNFGTTESQQFQNWPGRHVKTETQGQISGPCGILIHRPAFISLPSGSFTNKFFPSIRYSTSLPATRSLERSC